MLLAARRLSDATIGRFVVQSKAYRSNWTVRRRAGSPTIAAGRRNVLPVPGPAARR